MEIPTVLSLANISEQVWNEAIKKHDIILDQYDGVSFYRAVKKIGKLDRGSIVTDSEIIYEYPRIARILHLENGIKAEYTAPFYVEEKVDGYNVRITRVQGRILAFSRGGFICPFATDRLEDFFDVKGFFKKNPDLVICGEIAGPGNPYNLEFPPYVKEDAQLFAFDVRIKNSSKPIPVERRYEVFDAYGVPTVGRYGKFSVGEMDKLKDMIKNLNETGLEGFVFKPTNLREKTLKYVTVGSCLRDLRVTTHLMAELPPEFFTHRIIRALFYLQEHGFHSQPDFVERLGKVIAQPLRQTIEKISSDEMIVEQFHLKFRRKKNIKRLIDHLHRCKIDAKITSEKKIGNYWHVEYSRRYFPSFEMLKKYWQGGSHVD